MENDQINSSLECKICLETFLDPRVLSCGHSFCYRCITDYLMKTFCPLCSKPFNNLDDLPKNWAVQNLIDSTSKIPKTILTNISTYCENCEIHECPSDFWCENCKKFLCESCFNKVHYGRAYKNHVKMATQEKVSNDRGCPIHEGLSFDFYCPDDNKFACLKCKLVSNNRGNNKLFINMDKHMDNEKERLLKRVGALMNKEHENRVNLLEIQNEKINTLIANLEVTLKNLQEDKRQNENKMNKLQDTKIEIKTVVASLTKAIEEITIKDIISEGFSTIEKTIDEFSSKVNKIVELTKEDTKSKFDDTALILNSLKSLFPGMVQEIKEQEEILNESLKTPSETDILANDLELINNQDKGIENKIPADKQEIEKNLNQNEAVKEGKVVLEKKEIEREKIEVVKADNLIKEKNEAEKEKIEVVKAKNLIKEKKEVINEKPSLLFIIGSSGNKNGQFFEPFNVTTDLNGNILVADSGNNRIQMFDSKGEFICSFGNKGKDNLINPCGLAVAKSGNIIVVDYGNDRIQIFDSNGKFIFKFGVKGNKDGQFDQVYDVAVDNNDNILVVDKGNSRIQIFDCNGNFISKFSTPKEKIKNQPVNIAVSQSGHIVVANSHIGIQIFDYKGNIIRKFEKNIINENKQMFIWGIDVDLKNNIILSNTNRAWVSVHDYYGKLKYKFGIGGQTFLRGVHVDSNGNILVVDSKKDVIYVYGKLIENKR